MGLNPDDPVVGGVKGVLKLIGNNKFQVVCGVLIVVLAVAIILAFVFS